MTFTHLGDLDAWDRLVADLIFPDDDIWHPGGPLLMADPRAETFTPMNEHGDSGSGH